MADLKDYKTKLFELVPPKGSFQPTTLQDAQAQIAKIEKIENFLNKLNDQVGFEIVRIDNEYRKAKKAASITILHTLIKNDEEKELQLKLLSKNYRQQQAEFGQVKEFSNKLLNAYGSTKKKLISFIEQELGQAPKRFTGSLGGLLTEVKSAEDVNYKAYIRSRAWKKKAEAAKVRVGNRCQLCNRPRSEVQLEAHHRTYERLGHELPGDITVLCRDCHQAHEGSKAQRELSEKISEPNFGTCIRCGTQIPFNQHKPLCISCFKSWNRFRNMAYEERFCHACGISNPSAMSKPLCLDCYKKVKILGTH
jgi:RNA polymerase-binding transcription factor DksA